MLYRSDSASGGHPITRSGGALNRSFHLSIRHIAMSLKDSDSWPFEAIKYFSGMFRQLNAAYVVENNSGVAVTLSLFDHVLTFRKELDLVWLQRGPWSIMQLVVVMNRYGGEASMLYLAYSEY